MTRNLVRDVFSVATVLPQDLCTANVFVSQQVAAQSFRNVRCSSLMIKALRAINVIITLMYSLSFEMSHRIKSQGFYRVCKEATCPLLRHCDRS